MLDRRPATRAAVLLAAACFLAGILVCLAPADARVAVARLINPLGNTAWPRTTHLTIRRPVERIARGQPFEIEVVDAFGARLPPEVRIHYRDEAPDGGVVEETERMRFADGAMVARRENVQRPFSYRVEGGDDRSMPWSKVEVVEPPAVESLSIRLVPPAYTGWPAVPSERHIRALAGTEVRITGQATKPLAAADLCLEGGRKIPARDSATTAAGSPSATAGPPWSIEKSGAYWFDLTDREGLHGGADDRWEIPAIPDAPPTVRIEQPTANLFVTPRAVVPIRVAAKDDLAIRDVALVFRRGESEPERVLPLFSGPKQPPRQPGPNPAGDSRTVDYRWDLAALDLKPGTQLTFYATASDYRPQTGKSDPRRLAIVTPDELQERIADREKLIVAELQRALKMQRTCRSQVESLAIRLAELRRFEQTDVDRLQAAELGQREVGRLLTSRSEGVPMHVLGLLADLENNRLDSADARRQMTSLLAELDRLGREHLPPMDHQLTAAVKTVEVDREGQGGRPAPAQAWPTSPGRRRQAPGRGHRLAGAIARPTRPLGQLSPLPPRHRAVAPRSGRTCRGHVGGGPPHRGPRTPRPSPAGRRRSENRRRPASLNSPACSIACCKRWTRPGPNCGRAIRWPPTWSPTPSARPGVWPSPPRCATPAIRFGRTRSGKRPPAKSRSPGACRRSSTSWPIAAAGSRPLGQETARTAVRSLGCGSAPRGPAKGDRRRREKRRSGESASASWSGLPPSSEQLRDETQRLARQLERLQAAAAARAAARAAGQMDQAAGQGRAGGLRRRGRPRGRSPKVAGRGPPPA